MLRPPMIRASDLPRESAEDSASYEPLVSAIRRAIPSVSGVWLFGSRESGHADAGSDIDLALLADASPDPVALWELAQALAGIAGTPVDLLDLRAASTVMQYQVVHGGRLLWARDVGAGLFACFVLSEKTALDEARAGRLADIARTGVIQG